MLSPLPVGPAWAGPQVDCEGSAVAFRLRGIPCDCINGKIVCNQCHKFHKTILQAQEQVTGWEDANRKALVNAAKDSAATMSLNNACQRRKLSCIH